MLSLSWPYWCLVNLLVTLSNAQTVNPLAQPQDVSNDNFAHGRMLSDGMPSAYTEFAELTNEYMYYVSSVMVEAPGIIETVNRIVENQHSQTNATSIAMTNPFLQLQDGDSDNLVCPDYHGKMLSGGMSSADTDVMDLTNEYMYYVSRLEAEAPELFEQVNEIINSQQSLQTSALSIPEVEPLTGPMQECIGTGHQCHQTDSSHGNLAEDSVKSTFTDGPADANRNISAGNGIPSNTIKHLRQNLDYDNNERHSTVRSDTHPYKCAYCQLDFRRAVNFNQHMKKHQLNLQLFETVPVVPSSSINDDRKKRFKCQQRRCGRAFTIPGLLKRHMALHSEEQQFTRRLMRCNRKCKRRDYHRTLNETVVALPPPPVMHCPLHRFKCQEKRCDWAFTIPSLLKRHMLSHSNVKEFPCEWMGCNRKYKRRADLKRHTYSHTSDTQLCLHCNRKFAQKICLNRHQAKMHPHLFQL